MGIQVNTAAMHQAAGSIDDATASAHENVTNSLKPSETAVAANPGWLSTGGLDTCRQAWATHLNDLINRTAAAAENLRGSADHYQEVERRITDAIESIHWEAE